MTDSGARAGEVLARIFDVDGLRAIVTGAASGLGFAMAEVLAECGARVTLADIDATLLEGSTGSLLARGLDVRAFLVDVSDESRVQALFDDVAAAQGGVDVAIANAGIASVPGYAVEGGQRIDTVEASLWKHDLGVNLDGVLFTMKCAAAVMRKQGSGRIVAISSIAGLKAEPFVPYAYTASKAAVINIVRQAALDLAGDGVRVNAICPGPFKGTRIGGGNTLDPSPEADEMWKSIIPVGRMARPEELRGLTLLLTSPASSFITGQAFVIDGGAIA